MKKYFFAFLFTALTSFSFAQNVHIIGNFEGVSGANVTFNYLNTTTAQMGRATTDSLGNFEFHRNIKEEGFYSLDFNSGKLKFFLILKPGDSVTFKTHPVHVYDSIEITGSPINEEYYELKKRQVQIETEKNTLKNRYNAASREPKFDSVGPAVLRQYQQLEKENLKLMTDYMSANPGSLVNLFFTEAVGIDQHIPLYEKVDSGLYPKYSHIVFVNQLHTNLRIAKTIRIGEMAPDIVLPTPNGSLDSLSSLRGKYVLIDFWASWCGPCRRANPELVRIHNKYKDRGFTVFGVSLDNNKQSWLSGIEKDNLDWKHVSDLRKWSSAAARTYGVTGIPYTILIDPEGRIVAKNVKGAKLDQLLSQLLKDQASTTQPD